MATAGHDLKNALQSIELNAALLMAKAVEPGVVTTRGQAIRNAVAQATGIIADLAKGEPAPASEAPDVTDSRKAVVDAIHVLLPLAEEKSVALVAEVVGEPGAVQADPSALGRILSNLIGNAIKFTPVGGKVTVRAERTTGGVRFQVSDTGAGIPSEHISRIFERGFRGNPSESEGLGLGLA
ncbi:MAG: sensor histidine kinase, partial [Planctomycetota bacterium]